MLKKKISGVPCTQNNFKIMKNDRKIDSSKKVSNQIFLTSLLKNMVKDDCRLNLTNLQK